MFHSYSDTAGSQSSADHKLLVSVAVAATDRKWQRFDRRWMAALNNYGVRELHMKHFAHGKGEFASWYGDKSRRAEFLRRLTGVAKRGINKGFVAALVMPDYRALDREYQVSEQFQSPYSFAQSLALAQCLKWLSAKKGPNDKALFFVEEGDTGQRAFLARAEKILGWKPIPLPRKEADGDEAYTPLQIADLIAYEHRLAYERHIDENNTRPVREAFNELRRMLPLEIGIYDAAAIRRACEENEIPRREQ